MLGRDTEWRQGDLLTEQDAIGLELIEAPGCGERAIVISHDCDLPNDSETFVEVIIGRSIEQTDPMKAHARHPRELHITFSSESGESLCMELCYARRFCVCKEDFAKLERIDPNFRLPDEQLRALRQWLAARYARPAFPTAFEDHLRKQKGGKTVVDKIKKILEKQSEHLVGLFFDLGETRSVELPDNEPYTLSIAVVYDAKEGGPASREAAEEVANRLSSLFEDAYGTANDATEIALENCAAVADTDITLADLRRADHWRVEYLSLREDPPGEFVGAGDVPP